MNHGIDEDDMMPAQRQVLDDLANKYASVRVRGVRPKGSFSVYLDCFTEHPTADPEETPFGMPKPVRTYHVMPSGYVMDVTAGEPGTRPEGGRL